VSNLRCKSCINDMAFFQPMGSVVLPGQRLPLPAGSPIDSGLKLISKVNSLVQQSGNRNK
jgi:hypothetical protein